MNSEVCANSWTLTNGQKGYNYLKFSCDIHEGTSYVHATLAKWKDMVTSGVHVTLAKRKDISTSSFPVNPRGSAAIGTEIHSKKTGMLDSVNKDKWEAAGDEPGTDFSLNDYQTGLYCERLNLLPCVGFMVNGSTCILAFDVEKHKWREKNSSAGQLLQLLQFFEDLLSVVNYTNLLEIAVYKNLKHYVHQALYQILLEKLFAHFLSSAEVVLFLFEYLMGYIERGGWATYSDTSWEFRATYVSIELRLAAYFWFKFRARAGPGP